MRSKLSSRAVLIAFAATALLTMPASAATHVVNQVGITFDPDQLTIDIGDTVEWHWSSGSHTVTEGTPCTPSGGFDEPLTAGNPLVSVTFTDAGAIDYFCIPHCGAGMTGVIRVVGPENVPALSTWGLGVLVLALLAIGVVIRRRPRARLT